MATDTFRSLERALLDAAARALGRPDAAGLRTADAPSPEVGDLAIGCHGLGKEIGADPQALAQQIVAGLAGDARFRDARADRGYVNVRFERGLIWRTVAGEVAARPDDFGVDPTATREGWLIEYSGPNTNKPLHIGHLRNTILGFAMANVARLHGHEVTRYNIVNDRGIHICKSMVACHEFGGGVTPQSSGEKGDHLVGRLYSLFATKAKEEFEAWAGGAGRAEIDAVLASKRSEIAASADVVARKRFLGEQEKAGRPLPFKPSKTKPQLYPEKMKGDAALEADWEKWRAAHAADFAEI